ncbi:MAG: hypothetical protein R2939_18600 [Kofleriaceae bacterium]
MTVTPALLLAAATVLGATACGDDDACGPGSAPADGLVLAGDGLEVRYAGLVAGANNDCPAPDAPAGVVSLTIAGTQAGGAAPLTFCVPRPDLLGAGARALGTEVQVIDASATVDGCTLSLAGTSAPTGTATAAGACDDGAGPAGFALTLDGTVTVTRTCGAAVDELAMTLVGEIAVAPPP